MIHDFFRSIPRHLVQLHIDIGPILYYKIDYCIEQNMVVVTCYILWAFYKIAIFSNMLFACAIMLRVRNPILIICTQKTFYINCCFSNVAQILRIAFTPVCMAKFFEYHFFFKMIIQIDQNKLECQFL